jgi:hypothetical protein
LASDVPGCRRGARKPDGIGFPSPLEEAILTLLSERAADAFLCPSEAARRVGGEHAWRSLLEPARAAARRLVVRGAVKITQGGRRVDLSTAKGPILLRRTRFTAGAVRHSARE